MSVTATGLEVRDLAVRFGGVAAVKSLSLDAPVGRITGLIGPNGAGKTTTFNVCSGITRATGGSVSFCGHDLTRAPAASRAKLGIGRTFQRIELFDSLTVRQNVALGRESRLAGTNPVTQLIPRRGQRELVRQATQSALEVCGLAAIANERAGTLSTGQKRMVELARAIAGDFQLLLLDEPSSGLDHNESAHFSGLLRELVRTHGLGILIVEHDMRMITEICDYIYVLDFGQLIFEGSPREVMGSAAVKAAYLGEDPTAVVEVTP